MTFTASHSAKIVTAIGIELSIKADFYAFRLSRCFIEGVLRANRPKLAKATTERFNILISIQR